MLVHDKITRFLHSDTARCSQERPLQNYDRDYNNSKTHRLESLWDISIWKLPNNPDQRFVEDAWMRSRSTPKV